MTAEVSPAISCASEGLSTICLPLNGWYAPYSARPVHGVKSVRSDQ
jgi:hypothetical protein